MKLKELINGIDCTVRGEREVEVSGLTFDSRKVETGYAFIAQTGVHVDGHEYIEQTIAQGAKVIVCEKMPQTLHDEVTYILTPNSNKALGIMAGNWYGNPSRKLKLTGITGTNGKTTTVTLLSRLFRMMGYHVGLISTIVNRIDDEEIPATHTTPDAIALNGLLARMVEKGCQYAFMEVSSHSIVQERIAGLEFAGGIFSNITHDHLDFHKTMANYIAAKKGFFDGLGKEAFALTNIDDRNGMVMVQNCRARIMTYSLQKMADIRCRIVENTFQGLHLEVNGKEVWTRLVGRFNAYNLMAIFGTAVAYGCEENEALRLLSMLEAAEGRFQYVAGKGVTAIVDYAHTPDALQNVIDTINDIRCGKGNLITVVGCGGDRDPLKRPIMAQIGVKGSDQLILTSDNPRTEDPEKILDAMEAGLNGAEKEKMLRITDRRQAIKTAVRLAKEGDIVLVAGKGHEKYQDINGVKLHFDDREELEKIL